MSFVVPYRLRSGGGWYRNETGRASASWPGAGLLLRIRDRANYRNPEHQMEDHGCLYKISREDFKKSLLTDPEATKNLQYEKLDVRAKVVFADKHYFISRAGVVNTGNGHVLLDKNKFVDHLLSLKKCMTK